MTQTKHSPEPWTYDYSPYTGHDGREIPAFQVYDAAGDKVFDTNEDTPEQLQEANARMGAAAPRLLASLITCADLLADYDESAGEEGDAWREATSAIAQAIGTAA
jgi:hypothetical protein